MSAKQLALGEQAPKVINRNTAAFHLQFLAPRPQAVFCKLDRDGTPIGSNPGGVRLFGVNGVYVAT